MNSSNIKLLILFIAFSTVAKADDSIPQNTSLYEMRLEKYYKFWNSLIPSQVVIQNAGNMGLVSAGVGWDYGKRNQWETHLLVGFVPKHKSSSTKLTFTVKENFIPWRKKMGKDWDVEPLSCGMYLNAILGDNFWNQQPSRYPNNYYWFSTRFRINVFAGQRFTKNLDLNNKKSFVKSATFFYEVSTCDLYMIDLVKNSKIGFLDVIGLSLGMKLNLL